MQFVAEGPEIPDALLQAHEEGRVVFFCGAGISYPAGLPGFKGLVDEIYRRVGTAQSDIERDAYSRYQFDATLDLLEHRLPGQRLEVRRALLETLTPKMRRRGAKDTHLALLQLARSRDGALRLVTTNFDRIFARVTARMRPKVAAYPAPLLPIPKASRWDGIVYLHGLLPEEMDESALNRLVLTSGDFGLAYLTERWAARFVGELFRNYVVCFVGYSINDPVLRYMMDALAADRLLGEVTPQAYALGDCAPGHEGPKKIEWEAKGVSPILYRVLPGTHDHAALHNTLKAWAETYRDGITGRERIVGTYAVARPAGSTRQDDFVGRMLWALSHYSGLPAKRFADFDPVPSLDWLDAFTDARFGHADLVRFKVWPSDEVDSKLEFSLVARPAPYTHASWMRLVSGGADRSNWDDVMTQIARWLVRHLNDPKLILWMATHGGQLHPQFTWWIKARLELLSKLERDGNADELTRIRSQAPNAIPSPLVRNLWQVLLSGRVKFPKRDLDLFGWFERFRHDGLTTGLRFELREILWPKVELKGHLRLAEVEQGDRSENLRQFVNWELVLASEHVQSTIRELGVGESWHAALPSLLVEFQLLLRDALDLMRDLEDASDHDDRSHWYLPSITPHWQNRDFHDWVVLIELLRDSWLALRDTDQTRATDIAREWLKIPYPTFKRLALFAASREEGIASDEWVSWLTSDDAWWLWSVSTKRETLRLLVMRGQHLGLAARAQLEGAILAGPPRRMYVDQLEQNEWQQIVDRSVWLHLAKLNFSGSQLGAAAAERFRALSEANGRWVLAPNESDEFSHWMSGTGDPDFDENRDVELAPRKWRDLVSWLKRPRPQQRPFYEDNWREMCRTRFFHCALALRELAHEGLWPVDRWQEALQAWAEEALVQRAWRFIAPVVQEMPEATVRDLAHSLSWWLEAASKSLQMHEPIMLDLCQRLLQMRVEGAVDTEESVTRAINHPVGHVAQTLLNLWFKRRPSDKDLLPSDMEPLFTRLCNRDHGQFRHGRVVLATNLIALFRVDRQWTETNLLPSFDWSGDALEARAVWEGFLLSPRLYRPLLIAFKPQFLDTMRHFFDLGESGRQLAALLTYSALEPIETFSVDDLREAFAALPQEGLQHAAQALSQALEGAGEQRAEYWTNRISRFWREVWPKSRQLASPGIAANLARMTIAAREQFPAAVSSVLNWLLPVEHPHYVVHLLRESGLSAKYPNDALALLNAIIGDQQWAPPELRECLTAIATAQPNLLQDRRFERVRLYAQRHGIEIDP